MGAPQQKVIIASQNLLELAARERRVLLVDPAAVLLFALELNHLVAAVVDAHAILFAHKNAGVFFLVGRVAVVVKVQAANGVTARARMLVQLKHRRHATGQRGVLTLVDQVFELVAIALLRRAHGRGRQALKQRASPPHTYPPRPYRRPARKNTSCRTACRRR